jgi:hypothetical protein
MCFIYLCIFEAENKLTMEDNILQKYKDYYSARVSKYEGNPTYKRTYEAEHKLMMAVHSCSELTEMKEKTMGLNEQCAIALVKDQNEFQLKHYVKHEEVVRAMEPKEILQRADEFSTVLDLVQMVNDVSSRVSVQISMDESHSAEFLGNLFLLDEYRVYSRAQVPEKYAHIPIRYASEIAASLKESIQKIEENNSHWQSGWKVNPDVCFEARHMRKSPLDKEKLNELRQLFSSIVQR